MKIPKHPNIIDINTKNRRPGEDNAGRGEKNPIIPNDRMGACHHPERFMSCRRLVVTDIVGINRSKLIKIPMIDKKPDKKLNKIFRMLVKSIHHQNSERLDRPLKSGVRL